MSLTTTTIERERCKQMMIELREAKTNEKVGREIIKHYHFDEKVIKKKWMKFGLQSNVQTSMKHYTLPFELMHLYQALVIKLYSTWPNFISTNSTWRWPWRNEKLGRKVKIIHILFWLNQHGSTNPILIMFLSNDYWNSFDGDR